MPAGMTDGAPPYANAPAPGPHRPPVPPVVPARPATTAGTPPRPTTPPQAPTPPAPGYTPTERNLPVVDTAAYTPTQRDLPVISASAAAPGHEATVIDMPSPATAAEEPSPLYVVGDVHGYLDELRAALRANGLIDAGDHWAGGTSRLWFLGDFTDRGPDGVGVIDLVMQLSAEAAAAGGYCKALLGNHELLFLGAKRFGDTPVNSRAGTASFQAAWLLNGGQQSDMERLQDHHVQWMSRLHAMTLADRHLLLHSDATCYLDYGDTIEAVNDTVTQAIQRADADETWELFRRFTKRFAFRDRENGATVARELLERFGGNRIVHGHSPIPYLLGEADGEDDGKAPQVTGPHVYADGLAVAMDGGVTMDGTLLVTRLPVTDEPRASA